jgi:MGT family glycosyltransferase
MSVGEHLSVTDLGPIPANFIVRPQVPQLAVLERAAVFVNHAGMNSVQEGLVHGVPLIAVPQSPEQTTIARRLVRLEAGAMLTMRQMTSDRLLNVTKQVLTGDRYRQGAARLRDEIQAAGGYRRAAQEILAAVRTTAGS